MYLSKDIEVSKDKVGDIASSVSVENCTSARGLLELNWVRRLLETSRSRFLVSYSKLRTSRSHMSSALPSVLRFEVSRLYG